MVNGATRPTLCAVVAVGSASTFKRRLVLLVDTLALRPVDMVGPKRPVGAILPVRQFHFYKTHLCVKRKCEEARILISLERFFRENNLEV